MDINLFRKSLASKQKLLNEASVFRVYVNGKLESSHSTEQDAKKRVEQLGWFQKNQTKEPFAPRNMNSQQKAKIEIKKESVLREASYQITHDTIYSAFQTALASAKKQGYEISDDEEFDKITTSRKPDAGKHQDYHIELTKNGVAQKKMLHIQIYKHDTGRFELNFYIQ